MISLDDVIARLKAELVPGTLKAVGGAAELAAAMDQLKSSPEAFILPSVDRPSADTAGTMEVRQRVTQQFSVVVGFKNIGPKGDAQLNKIDAVRREVMRTLIGWVPDHSQLPINYAGGRMVAADFDQGVMFWGCEFSGTYYIRSETNA